MREIRFRAWQSEDKQMIYSPLITSNDGADKAFTSFWAFIEDNTIYAGDVQIMQYIGLKDKNGKEIYEGDVINYLDNSHDYGEFGFGIRKGVCEFSNHTGSFFFRGDDGDTRDYMNLVNMQEKWSKESYQTVSSPFRDGKLVKSYTEIEIIGNIYENPNLLSQDK